MCMTDVVIAWVDGDDPAHKRKKTQYLTGKNETKFDDVAGAMRYRSTGEIYYCVASVLRYAPWVRKIYIVTDNQNPHVDEFVAHNFPDNTIPIELVDHKVLFRGYEQYLPTFNSLAISTMLWRIPGISDSFLYFNDDVFPLQPCKPTDFFVDGICGSKGTSPASMPAVSPPCGPVCSAGASTWVRSTRYSGIKTPCSTRPTYSTPVTSSFSPTPRCLCAVPGMSNSMPSTPTCSTAIYAIASVNHRSLAPPRYSM